jgi:hypothetical protein
MNDECRMMNPDSATVVLFDSAFCILHSAF